MAWNFVRFPGLRTGFRVEIVGSGRLSFGAGARIGDCSRIEVNADAQLVLGPEVNVGRNCYFGVQTDLRQMIGARTAILDFSRINGSVAIGKGCILASNVFISSGTHAFDVMPYSTILDQNHRAPARDRPVRLFDDCWLGVNAVIMPGVTVGRGCIIGANAVVTKDLPPYSVAAGVPARVVRRRLDFTPPSRIEAAHAFDNPYFYDGFALSTIESSAGRLAEGDFTLALSRSHARTIRLCVSGSGELAHGQHRRALPSAQEVIEFPLAIETLLPFLQFHVSGFCSLFWAELA